MTVGELITRLEEFDSDTEVVIGMQQRRGSNFATEIVDVSEEQVDIWDDGEEENPKVVITQGSQIGTVSYDRDTEEDEY